jgi:hypothetical protein
MIERGIAGIVERNSHGLFLVTIPEVYRNI